MKIAIAGFGREGQANFDYWSKLGDDITIVDEGSPVGLPEGVPTILGSGAFEKLDGFDLVVRTAGLAPYKIKTDGKIWSGTNEFLAKCQNTIVGVTGTKGKGTTSSFITSILEAAGKKVWLLGNIGIPSLKVLDEIQPDDIVVYEMSSFQLWDAEKSPQVAVVLSIEPDHLDVHKGFDDYVNAKANIRRYQTDDDFCVFYADNEYSRKIAATSTAPSQEYALDASAGSHIQDGLFYVGDTIICSTSEVKPPGSHNVENACAAVAAAHHLGISNDDIATGLRNFQGLEHRIKYVATIDDVEYYDDSIATTPGSAVAALKAFDKPEIIILGGSFKGADFSELAQEILHHDARAILIGAEAGRLEEAFQQVGYEKYEIIEDPTMPKIVQRAHDLAAPGSVVLLSPAAASFGLFKDYADRGNQFIEAVKAL